MTTLEEALQWIRFKNQSVYEIINNELKHKKSLINIIKTITDCETIEESIDYINYLTTVDNYCAADRTTKLEDLLKFALKNGIVYSKLDDTESTINNYYRIFARHFSYIPTQDTLEKETHYFDLGILEKENIDFLQGLGIKVKKEYEENEDYEI